jgi:hypothetical protein
VLATPARSKSGSGRGARHSPRIQIWIEGECSTLLKTLNLDLLEVLMTPDDVRSIARAGDEYRIELSVHHTDGCEGRSLGPNADASRQHCTVERGKLTTRGGVDHSSAIQFWILDQCRTLPSSSKEHPPEADHTRRPPQNGRATGLDHSSTNRPQHRRKCTAPRPTPPPEIDPAPRTSVRSAAGSARRGDLLIALQRRIPSER